MLMSLELEEEYIFSIRYRLWIYDTCLSSMLKNVRGTFVLIVVRLSLPDHSQTLQKSQIVLQHTKEIGRILCSLSLHAQELNA